MSPRRSSRARTTQPPPGVTGAHSTTSSSASSSRGDRAARTNHKQSSPQKSSTPHSLSSEDLDDPPRDSHVEPPLTRRRTREQDADDDDATKLDDELDEDIAEEEDEVTRCLCGLQEYPGPPSDAGKSKDGQSASVTDSDIQGDEAGGLFIQCDVCKVWQHGGCVGIMDEAASPDEYFCEECRKDLHKVMVSSKGQRYSRYLPVYDHHHGKKARKTSISKEPENMTAKERERISRASAESLSKRRSTMNSRAAYDEDEVLRKVLEESKQEGTIDGSENGTRKKRSRDESEETKHQVKRQRTGSRSPSNSPVIESEDDITTTSVPKQKPRGAAARSQREKELREKEKERTEAANRRKGRAERRKGEDSEPPEAPVEEPAAVASTSESMPPEPPVEQPLKPAPAPRKGGRPPQKRQSRLGRNQYTRDAPTATNGASPAANDDAPNSPRMNTANGAANGHDSSDGTTGKQTKPKNWRLQKLSWHDIRRPAGAMQNYISQRQVDLAGGQNGAAPAVQALAPPINGLSAEAKDEEEDLASFKNLSTLQMMDHLSRDLTHWQQMISVRDEK